MYFLLALLCAVSIANSDTVTIGRDLIQFSRVNGRLQIENLGSINSGPYRETADAQLKIITDNHVLAWQDSSGKWHNDGTSEGRDVMYEYKYKDLPNTVRSVIAYPVVTDSVVWRTVSVDSLNTGKKNCKHDWVYSDTWRAGGNMQCCVLHHGEHCDYDDLMRNRICRVCLRKETQREFWYQHRAEPPESEYGKLENRLNK